MGLPGVSTFYALPTATTAVADLVAFFDVIDNYMPTGVSVTVPNSGDSIESSTGALVGGWTSSGGATKTGLSTNEYAAGVGVRVTWTTGTVSRGRRVRGATFLAPLTRAIFDNNGTLASTPYAAIQAAAAALGSAGSLLVWSRPTTPGGTDGAYATISGATIPDRITSLRSRRY